jgi:superfamily II DNA helicase RecQ
LNLPPPEPSGGKKITLWESTIRLVGHLTGLLEVDEQILVFFEKRETANAFSIAAAEDPIIHNCAVYHSHLPTNSKAYNLSLWDSGRSQVMAATTAAGQGIDRPHVKFVIIHGHTYGMTSYIQQGGRGGRGGRPSYVILLRDPRVLRQTCPGKEGDLDVNCVGPFLKYTANKDVCRRKMLLNTMDREAQSVGC